MHQPLPLRAADHQQDRVNEVVGSIATQPCSSSDSTEGSCFYRSFSLVVSSRGSEPELLTTAIRRRGVAL